MLQEALDNIRSCSNEFKAKFISKCIERAAELGMNTHTTKKPRNAYVKVAEVLEFFKREGFVDDFDLTSKLYHTPERSRLDIIYEMGDNVVEITVTINLE
jgi:hypothetical protein